MVIRLAFCLFAIGGAGFAALLAVPVHDLRTGDLRTGEPTLLLAPQDVQARAGKVWIRKSNTGLIIAGHVGGEPAHFPTSVADLMRGDHVELWLNVVPNPVLPEIGWGNQFGETLLPEGEVSCADLNKDEPLRSHADALAKCVAWAKQQKHYRAYFLRLFTRQWQFAPGLAKEVFATPAYEAINQLGAKDTLPDRLQPVKRTPQFRATPLPTGGYDFEIQVPWELFPPSDQLALSDVRVAVEVFGPAKESAKSGPFSTTAPGRHYGEASEFNQLHFDRPRRYRLTPCSYALEGLDVRDKPAPAYFFPQAAAMLDDDFILENYKAGYAYEPSGLSPRTRQTHFFALRLHPDEFVCGPILRYRKGDVGADLVTANSKEEQEQSQGNVKATSPIVVDQQGFATHAQKDGTLLIKSGPRKYYSRYGSGQCGACVRAGLEIYARNPDGTTDEIFHEETVVDGDADYDVQLAPDWSRIDVYRSQNASNADQSISRAAWKDDQYCLKDGDFEECGPERHMPPPEPRTLTFSPGH